MSYLYNFIICSTDTCNSFAGDTEGSVGGAVGVGAFLGFVRGYIVDLRTFRVFFMWP